jgi:hypothetical protein
MLEGTGVTLKDLERLQQACEPFYWWDAEVLSWFSEFGPSYFRKLDIWDVDWNRKVAAGCPGWSHGDIIDPRSRIDRGVLSYLGRTQPQYGTARQRWLDRLLRWFW